jgi:hypothetical protein
LRLPKSYIKKLQQLAGVERGSRTRIIFGRNFRTLEIGVKMPNFYVKLPLQNEILQPINIVLELLAESFTIAPSERVEVHALCDDKTNNIIFTVAPNDSFLTIYAPGELLDLLTVT